MIYLSLFRYIHNVVTLRVVKMKGENFDDSCEISGVEDELDFALLADDLSEIELDHLETDSDDSDVIVVRKKKNCNY